MARHPDVDVLVIGSGAAGLAAALQARDAGARSIIVAESEDIVGGSSALSGGYVMGAGTRIQRAAGIDDSAEALFRHYLTLNAWQVDVAVVRRLCERAGASIDWLEDLGVEFSTEVIYGGDEYVPRVHMPIQRGQGVVDALHRASARAGVEFALRRRVDRLLADPVTGQVTGAAVGADELTAGSVVIATGGFGGDRALMEQYFPSATNTEWTYYIGAPGARGDHLTLGTGVAAQLTGFDRGLRLLHANFDSMYESYLPGWLVLVNSDARRFCDETAPYGILDRLVAAQGDRVWALFDRATLDGATRLGVARYKQYRPTTTTKQSPHWVSDVIDQMVRAGRVHESAGLAGLAQATGLPLAQLEGTLERYNASTRQGEDVDYGKSAKFLDPIAVPPFYAVELRPATVCWTGYGLRIDRDARVLNATGAPIAGLFAAGECTANVIGPVYVGSGNSYANCVTFGRIAGQSAATAALAVSP